MSDEHTTKNLEFSPLLGLEKLSSKEKLTFNINGSYIYQIEHQEHEYARILPLNWKIWFIPVYFTSFVFLGHLTMLATRPKNDCQVYIAMTMTAIASLFLTIMTTVVDISKYVQTY